MKFTTLTALILVLLFSVKARSECQALEGFAKVQLLQDFELKIKSFNATPLTQANFKPGIIDAGIVDTSTGELQPMTIDKMMTIVTLYDSTEFIIKTDWKISGEVGVGTLILKDGQPDNSHTNHTVFNEEIKVYQNNVILPLGFESKEILNREENKMYYYQLTLQNFIGSQVVNLGAYVQNPMPSVVACLMDGAPTNYTGRVRLATKSNGILKKLGSVDITVKDKKAKATYVLTAGDVRSWGQGSPTMVAGFDILASADGQVVKTNELGEKDCKEIKPVTTYKDGSFALIKQSGGQYLMKWETATDSGDKKENFYASMAHEGSQTIVAVQQVNAESTTGSAYQTTFTHPLNTEADYGDLNFTLKLNDAGWAGTVVSNNLADFNLDVRKIPYPNPTSGQQQIEVETARSGKAMIQIYDMQGVKLSEQTQEIGSGGTTNLQYDLGSYPAGYYIIKLIPVSIEGKVLKDKTATYKAIKN